MSVIVFILSMLVGYWIGTYLRWLLRRKYSYVNSVRKAYKEFEKFSNHSYREVDMPIYDYHCVKCNNTIELIRKTDDREQPVYCATCHYTLIVAISAANVNGNLTPKFHKR